MVPSVSVCVCVCVCVCVPTLHIYLFYLFSHLADAFIQSDFKFQLNCGLIVEVLWNWLEDLPREHCNSQVWTEQEPEQGVVLHVLHVI